jgi:hypothetical protein
VRLTPANLTSPERSLFAPLIGMLVGAAGGLIYWFAAQVFPTSVAVILSMAATALWTARLRATSIFFVLVKYNTLMALSAAKLPFAAPPNVALGLVLVCAHAASFALMASVTQVSGGTLIPVLLLGFVPAAVLGIPGLFALAAAIAASIAYAVYLKRSSPPSADGRARSAQTQGSADTHGLAQALAEVCFYLGALASWSYV